MGRIYKFIGGLFKSPTYASDGTWILRCDDGTSLELSRHSIQEDYEDGERVQITEFRGGAAGGRQIRRLETAVPPRKPGSQSEGDDRAGGDDDWAAESWESDDEGVREEETGVSPMCPFCG